ncbi:DUF3010 family protein [Dyadobacter fermentans]|uniref:DUF3010 family protein n=1 Tax=Dyadobacter fermentans TaxID=94254 RepID=UPI001CBB3232|nr:DUF3010 family protein [Dyadobacter fermentans]MBZ1358479.1 DUF3010 family protein [Dyadobacter fermentans]
MKTLGIQIKSDEAILVVLEQSNDGKIFQTNECAKFNISESENPDHVKHFRDQIFAAFDSISPARVGILARNANGKGQNAPSPMSFKLEGIIQLYEKIKVEIIWPQSINAFLKKNDPPIPSKHKYQADALNVAYYLTKQR